MNIKISDKNIYLISAIFLMGLSTLLFVVDGFNAISHQIIAYDEAYNATVAANIMRFGEYRVSYPSYTCFYNMITTGVTVILPTALLYKLFGINNITSSIVAMIYSVLCIWCIWKLLYKAIKGKGPIAYLISSILTIILLLSDGLFAYVSTHLIGESAALFFLFASFNFIMDYLEKKEKLKIFLSGVMLASAFLTKSSVIFFVVSCFGMVLVEGLIKKNISKNHIVIYFMGFIGGFAILDSFKMIQLGGWYNYLKWWFHEWKNMLDQSSGVDIAYSMSDKFKYLEVIFLGHNKYFCIFIILLPVVLYFISLVFSLVCKKELFSSKFLVITMAGVAGSSLLIYFILLGGTGLVYARRHMVNALFIRFFFTFILSELLIKAVEKLKNSEKKYRKILIYILSFLIGAFLLFPREVIISNVDRYIKKEKENVYELELMNQFLDEIALLPETATLYCAGWWQEPAVTLFLDRDMKDIYEVIKGETKLENDSYFIVGNYILDESKSNLEAVLNVQLDKVDSIEINYGIYPSAFDRKDFDNFAIYEIKKNIPLE